MGVSFKVLKKGARFRPKPKPESPSVLRDNDEVDASPHHHKIQVPTKRKILVDATEDDADAAGILDAEVSFILNIFPDGYSIGNPSEGNIEHKNAVQDDPKFLHPYDRTSESLFAAIECGRLPADFLDGIACKYSNGAVVCEVRDYRRDSSEQGVNGPCITKVSLKMSLDNVVKDFPKISDSAWTYGDLMEAESRILKALQPRLCLDPTPNLDRLCKEPTSLKLNLNIPGLRLKRLRQMSVSEKFCVDRGDSRLIMSCVQGIRHSNGGSVNKQGIGYLLKQEPVDAGRMDKLETNNVNPQQPKQHLRRFSPVGKKIDSSISNRFSKIQMLTARFKLNCLKNKIDEYKEATSFPTQQLIHCLSDDESLKDEKCEMPLSRSLMGGNMNICKTRVLKFVQADRVAQQEGNGLSVVSKLQTRMILSEKQICGTVAMHYGEVEGFDYLIEEERLPTLANTHTADLLAAQFCSLMEREGYCVEGDHLQPKEIKMIGSNAAASHNMMQTLTQKSEPQSSLYQQKQLQRSAAAMKNTSNSNMKQQLGNSMLNKIPLSEQESQMQQWKVMMGSGRNSMVGVQGMGSSINQQLHSEQLTPQHAAVIMANKLKGQSINRQPIYHLPSTGFSIMGSGINNMQRNVMAGMNHQQQLYLQQGSTLRSQALCLPPQQVGSPSPLIGMPHQQQMSLEIPPSRSAGSQETPQNLGSVGTMANSPFNH